jgi:hypothetical protein
MILLSMAYPQRNGCASKSKSMKPELYVGENPMSVAI